MIGGQNLVVNGTLKSVFLERYSLSNAPSAFPPFASEDEAISAPTGSFPGASSSAQR